MKFNLYFAGGVTESSILSEFKTLQCNRLLSFYNDKNLIKNEQIKLYPGNIFIDSGAYSAHTRGVTIDLEDYINYINNNNWVSLFASLDVLPGTSNSIPTIEECQDAAEISWKNYLYMRERVVEKDKILPVYHQGESIKNLHNILNYSDAQGNKVQYIGLGAMANLRDSSSRKQFLDKCFDVIEKERPDIKVHGFGMTTLELLNMYPFTSADSTTWRIAAAMGEIITEYGRISVSNQCKKYSSIKEQNVYEAIKQYVTKYGFELSDLEQNSNSRAIFNIRYLKDWERNYTYTKRVKTKHLFTL